MSKNKTAVLLPLYIYPSEGAWSPLYNAIETYPTSQFIIVINPASGPGSGNIPDSNWVREISRLNTYKNVHSIGYIAVTYGKRSLDVARTDIEHYAKWADEGLIIEGIFVDEVPSSADESSLKYVRELEMIVRNFPELGNGRIVFNPGTIADRRILNRADLTVIAEQRYQTFVDRQLAKSFSTLSQRGSLVCIMHSIPQDLPLNDLKPLVHQLRAVAGTLFLTDLSVDYYHSFSPRFAEFVDLTLKEE